MSKHRLQKNNRIARGLLLGAITAGAVMIPVAPAVAQPLSIPGLGNIEIPGLPPVGAITPDAVVTHGQRALDAAQTKIGAPYVWGATGPDTFDCSGLVQWAYRQAGVSVPRTTYDQINGGTPVGKGDLQPGDVVLFYGTEHVGLYAGGGMVVHAPTPGQSVKRAPLDSMPFTAARRY